MWLLSCFFFLFFFFGGGKQDLAKIKQKQPQNKNNNQLKKQKNEKKYVSVDTFTHEHSKVDKCNIRILLKSNPIVQQESSKIKNTLTPIIIHSNSTVETLGDP